MINKKIKFFLIGLIISISILIINTPKSFSKSQELDSLKYDVKINDNGSMDVIEYWDVDFDDVNTLYKDFESKYKYTKVSVVEKSDQGDISYTQDSETSYHVNPQHFYAEIYEGKFEIAWNVSGSEESNSGRKNFIISYTVEDALTNQKDFTELYWQFVGKGYETIPADSVDGEITLPEGIEKNDDVRVWAHGPVNGNVSKGTIEENDVNKIKFSVKNLGGESDDFLEIRVAIPSYIFKDISLMNKGSLTLNDVINEEQAWADETNKLREKARRDAYIMQAIICLIDLLIIFKIIKNIIYYKNINADMKKNIQKIDYFRELPEKTATPGEAELIINNGQKFNIKNVFSAILMDLALKKYVEFEENSSSWETKNVIIKVNNNENLQELKEDEEEVYRFLRSAVGSNGTIAMKEFREYAKENKNKSFSLWNGLKDYAINDIKIRNLFDQNMQKKGIHFENEAKTACILFVLYISLIPFLIGLIGNLGFGTFLVLISGILLLGLSIVDDKISKKMSGLNIEAIQESEKWKGFKKYMEDYSLLKEKEVPDLKLWEHYLVFATAFGISKKVTEQLKIAVPDLKNDDYLINNYGTLYFIDRLNVGDSFADSMSYGYQNYVTSNYSSGSGGGGGFSFGGGGRTEVEEDLVEDNLTSQSIKERILILKNFFRLN